MWRTLAKASAVAAALCAAAPSSFAQDWPTRPITILVPWGAGGGTDLITRNLAQYLEKDLGVAVNVINRTGGNGVTGHTAIAEAKPDGYTLGAVTAEVTMLPHMGLTKLTYEDYTPIALLNRSPAGVTVRKDASWTSLENMMADIKANPGKYKASGTAQGGIWHLAMAGLLKTAGMDVNAAPWIPSQGAARALQDLLAGGVDIVTASPSEALSLIEAGQVKPLAVMNDTRMEKLPNVPTSKEAGVDWQLASFISLQAPKGLDPKIQSRLDESVRKVLQSKEWKDFAASRGVSVDYAGPAELKTLQERLSKNLGEVMQALGLMKS